VKYISLDIDGIVNNYPITMYKYAFDEMGWIVNSKKELIEKLTANKIKYLDFKYNYRKKYECIEKTNFDAEVTKDFFDFYKEIKQFKNINIVFRTTRPESIYPGTLLRTQEWLKYNGIDHIVTQKDQKSFNLYNPILHLDDEIESLDSHKNYTSIDRLYLFKKNKEKKTSFNVYNVINKLNDLCLIIQKM